MTNFHSLQNRLLETFRIWNQFNHNEQKQKINLIMPFVQLASYLERIEPNLELTENLRNFATTYQDLYQQDLRQMASSDFSNEIFSAIAESQKTKTKISDEIRNKILQYNDKYVHAHNRVMFNYGAFLQQSFAQLTADQQLEIQDKVTQIKTTEDPENLLKLLEELNQDFALEKNSAVLEKDDLENHALLNQMTTYNSHIAQISAILLDDEKFVTAKNYFFQTAAKQTIKRDSTTPDLSSFQQTLAEKGLRMTVGLESEFLLNPTEKKNSQTATQQNIAIKKNLADINARRKMQLKYGFAPTLPEITDDLLLLHENSDFSDGIRRADFNQITQDIENYVISPNERKALNQQVASFSEAETFFYKLFLLEDFAYQNGIEMDGIFDPKKSRAENFATIKPLILSGRFHENLLDMIQAHEISVGPFEVNEILSRKNEVFEKLRLLANQSQASLDDANVQINSAFTIKINGAEKNVLLPEIIKENGETRIEFNKLGSELLNLMEEAAVELGDVPGILRQTRVNASLDRNKFVGKELADTPFRQINEELPAFLNHKFLAAKNSTLRLSFINNEVAVVELRLVGNNTHFAQFQDGHNLFRSGIDFISEKFLSKVDEKISTFIKNKSAEELAALYNEKTTINHEGIIGGVAEHQATKVTADPNYNSLEQKNYNPESPALKVSLVKFQPLGQANLKQI